MRSILFALLVAVPGASAQVLMDPARAPAAFKSLEPKPGEPPLRCEVTPLRPALNFGFRFQAGYVVRVPMDQYSGPRHRWGIIAQITPEGGSPIYIGSRMRLPDIPKTKQEMEVGGGYLLGEGRYYVRFVLFDEVGRACRKEWSVDAKLHHGEHSVRLAMPARTVSDLALHGAPPGPGRDDAPPFRLTILMNAAPISPRRTRLGGRDRMLLLGTVSSLLERLPASTVRLVVFNLDQQRELYRQDDFAPAALDQVGQALNELELGLVDYKVLQNRRGHVDLLAELVNRELSAPQPSDVVLFLGPLSRFLDKVPESAVDKPEGPAPRFFYLQYRSPFRMESVLPDSINRAVSKLRGKTVVIRSPGDFAKAIEQVERKAFVQ
jgi:hypothetical protein